MRRLYSGLFGLPVGLPSFVGLIALINVPMSLWRAWVALQNPAASAPATGSWQYWSFCALGQTIIAWATLTYDRRRFRRKERRAKGLCLNCAYDLRAHAAGQKCPECGLAIPADLVRKPIA